MSVLGGDWELPDLVQQASVSTKGPGGPCCSLLLSLQARYAILMTTQAKKLAKTEACLLKSS